MAMLAQIVLLLAGTVSAGQGNAVRLSIPNEAGISAVSILWQNKTVPYVRVDNEWVAIIGVDLDVKAGSYSATIRVTKKGASGDVVERRPLTILVKAVKYPTTELKVADEYVDLSKENADRAVREQKELDGIHGTISKERYWTEPFVVPIAGETGTNFGHRRVFNGQARAPHAGADLHAVTGTPIHATNRGRVVLAKELFFTGNTVIVDHGLRIYSLYAHLSRIDVDVGSMVDRNQVLGLSGATGRVTGPHLHWGIKVQNARVDPFSLVNLGKP
jgi:murein DD-endopeptidase MepM/ murein hydrolase activator NlpD